jgi:hypothetical protein
MNLHILLIGLSLPLSFAQAQPATTGSPKPTATTAPREPGSPEPLATKHIGSEIDVVLPLLWKGIGKAKGEFETTEEFDDRRTAVLEKLGTLHTFPAKEQARYDADNGMVRFELSSVCGRFMRSEHETTDPGNYLTIELKTKKVYEGSYVGQSAFGVTAKILARRYVEYGLVLRTDSPVRFHDGMRFEFPMERRQAIESISWLRLYLQGEIVGAAIYEYSDRESPTLTNPREVLTSFYYIPFRVDKALVVDTRSGKTVYTFEGVDDEGKK